MIGGVGLALELVDQGDVAPDLACDLGVGRRRATGARVDQLAGLLGHVAGVAPLNAVVEPGQVLGLIDPETHAGLFVRARRPALLGQRQDDPLPAGTRSTNFLIPTSLRSWRQVTRVTNSTFSGSVTSKMYAPRPDEPMTA